MKNKAPLALMEQLVMTLVFALAAAVCLQVFVFSEQMSRRNEIMDRAVLAAQSAAETVKYTRGDYQQAAQISGGSWDGTHWYLLFQKNGHPADHNREADFRLYVSTVDSGQPLLGMAEIRAETADGQVLFVIPAAWQEVDEHGPS